jgi:16S rRNA (cytosine1402-N4)-methyltransferase
MGDPRHLPVLLQEVIEYLKCQPAGIYVDGTVGSGGHAEAILERSSPTGKLIGLDWDEEAIQRARKKLALFGRRVELREKNFKDLRRVLELLSVQAVDGILLDLGVSTEQLEDRERGFSFRWEGPLDMRMSRETKIKAQDLLQRLSVSELSEILRQYGEERWANRIAKAIVRRRQTEPIHTTRELLQVLEKSLPRPFHRGRIHPATRTFQALRIAVNEELNNLQTFLDQCPDLLHPGGRLCIISFHSLEDRIVKDHFRRWASFRILTPKPVVPSSEEVFLNPRARSAKLRVAEKL